ncbi:hypothetical protein [Streptomyces hainanensis]|uniref:Uncharacterized protein n=1 Tax=Streptomyces hainanensis TaxID=402648 RepID=A0A4R4TAU2_9ACTN|nr:hypothetical protein [Streptomyces hainanensis]TDC74421.1 hypothetical protein E1283_15740 [Streptomyces hainanensis]
MPLRIPSAPALAEQTVVAALREDTTRKARPAHLVGETPRLVLPLPLHRLTPVGSLAEPPRARLTGWRFLLEAEGRAVGAAETALTADGWEFSHFLAGPFIASTERGVGLAESLPTPYQPRLLSIPELYMLTLWLHADLDADPTTGDPLPDDLLVPLAPAPPGIAADRPVRTDALLPLVTSRVAPLGLAS